MHSIPNFYLDKVTGIATPSFNHFLKFFIYLNLSSNVLVSSSVYIFSLIMLMIECMCHMSPASTSNCYIPNLITLYLEAACMLFYGRIALYN